MLARALLRLLNLPALLAHRRQHRSDRSVWDPADDLELALYGSVFGNHFLHYGYFADPAVAAEDLSFNDLCRAMDDYATLLVTRCQPGERVLDVGCGMGGLLARLLAAGMQPTGLTPNRAHAAHIRAHWPQVPLLESTLEAAPGGGGFDVVINSESFQYIALDDGMRRVRAQLDPAAADPRWLVIDYFRLDRAARNRSGHLRDDFEAALPRHGWQARDCLDITEHVLPSLAYGRMLATRFALPMVRFGSEKLLRRRPLLDYLVGDAVRTRIDGIRLHTLDPDTFRREKRYLLYTLTPIR